MPLARRGLLAGLAAALAAPAIIRTQGLLMPVRPAPLHTGFLTADEIIAGSIKLDQFRRGAILGAGELYLDGRRIATLSRVEVKPKAPDNILKMDFTAMGTLTTTFVDEAVLAKFMAEALRA